jgi:hypothetical protein
MPNVDSVSAIFSRYTAEYIACISMRTAASGLASIVTNLHIALYIV